MINHARTLLINSRPQNNQRQDAGYEYTPDTFQPVALSATLTAVHKILFGTKPDTYFLNLRARELLTYIHQTELADYIYKLDPRVTYWPTTNAPFFENAKPTVTVVQFAGPPLALNLGGTFSASDATGTTTKRYEVTASRTDGAYVSLRDLEKLDAPTVIELTDPANPQIIELPETKLRFKLDIRATTETYALLTELADVIIAEQYAPEAGLGLNPATTIDALLPSGIDTAKWTVTARANPRPAITALLPILEILGEPLFLALFGVAPVEPYATFKNLWFDHPLAAYRLAGLVLAFIYRADELRKVNDG